MARLAHHRWIGGLLLALAPHVTAASPEAGFQSGIAPVLADRCVTCHGATRQKAGYRVDSYAHLLTPGESRKAPITPGDPSASHLFQLLTTSDADDRMPQKGEPLDASILETFRRWIASGAPFDGSDPSLPLAELLAGVPYPDPPLRYLHPIPIQAVALLETDRLAVGGYHEVTFWSPNGTLLRRRRGLPERIHRLVVHPDGHRLFFCGGTPGKEGVAGWLDLANDAPASVFLRRPDDALTLAVSPDGRLVAVAGTEPDIVLSDGFTGERQRTLRGHADWVLGLAFNPAGRLLASASRDRTARVFDAATGNVVSAFRDHNEAVTAITFLDDDRLASGGRDGRVRSWTALDAKAGKSSPAHEGEVTWLLAVNGRLLSAWTRGGVLEHRVDNLEVTREYPAKDERVLGLAGGGDRTELSAVTHGGRVHLWDLASARPLGEFLAAPGH